MFGVQEAPLRKGRWLSGEAPRTRRNPQKSFLSPLRVSAPPRELPLSPRLEVADGQHYFSGMPGSGLPLVVRI